MNIQEHITLASVHEWMKYEHLKDIYFQFCNLINMERKSMEICGQKDKEKSMVKIKEQQIKIKRKLLVKKVHLFKFTSSTV